MSHNSLSSSSRSRLGRRRRCFHLEILTLLSLLVSWCLTGSLGAADQDAEFLSGLRQRRLFSLAETYCLERLGRQALTDQQRANLTVELMQTHAQKGVQKTGAERAEAFAQAERVADEFLRLYSERPRFIIVQVQQAMNRFYLGQTLRLEIEVGLGDNDTREQALAELRASIEAFGQIDSFLELEVPKRFRRVDEGQLNADQLLGLRQRVRYQRGIAIENRARLFAADDRLNRIDSLTQVVSLCEELSAAIPQDNELWWQVKLEQAKCLRLMGRGDASQQLIAELPESPPSDRVRELLTIERVQNLLANNQPQQALSFGWEAATNAGFRSAELDEGLLEAMLAVASDDSLAENQQRRWQDQAVAFAQQIKKRHGPFFGRRADLQLVGASGNSPQIENLTILIELADEHFRNEEFDAALAAYQRTEQVAEQQQNLEFQYRAGRMAGLVLFHRLDQPLEASRVLRDISIKGKQYSDAIATHQQAAWIIGQLANEQPELLEHYIELLEENISLWAREAATAQSRIWLGQAYEFRQQYAIALDIYLDVPMDSPLAEQGVRLAIDAADRAIETDAGEESNRSTLAAQIAHRFETWLPPAEDSADQSAWTSASAWACLAASRLRVLHRPDEVEFANQQLQRALNSPSIQKVNGDERHWRFESSPRLTNPMQPEPSKTFWRSPIRYVRRG